MPWLCPKIADRVALSSADKSETPHDERTMTAAAGKDSLLASGTKNDAASNVATHNWCFQSAHGRPDLQTSPIRLPVVEALAKRKR